MFLIGREGSAEAPCVAAFAAEFFLGGAGCEAVIDGLGPGRGENVLHFLGKEIAQCQVTLVVQAAGDGGAVAEDAQLVPEAVAEYLAAALRGSKVRPVEFVAVLQEEPVTDSDAPLGFLPGTGESPMHGIKNLLILFFQSTLVPETVDHQLFTCGCLTKGEAIGQVIFKGDCQVVCLEGMKGDVYLVQAWGGQKHIPMLSE